MKMHDGEVDITAGLVRQLLADQFPGLAGLPLREERPMGTVNAVYRLGGGLCVRLPRVQAWAASLDRELRWLPRLAPQLTLRIPEPAAAGQPACGYPFTWALYRWIEGQPYPGDLAGGEQQAAADLARFISELRQLDPAGAPRGGGLTPRETDTGTRAAIGAARAVIDSDAAMAAWVRALAAPGWDGRPAWIHADLLRPNLLVHDGRLSAVLDFGSAGAGDPAADLIPAWSVFTRAGRGPFRRALGAGDDLWERARGYALHQAAMIIPYYSQTSPGFAAQAARTIAEVIADVSEHP